MIELLVVIAIIAILAALLLPALVSVKNRSQMVTDINNCRQIMLSTIMYGNNSNEHLPQPGWQMAVKNWAADANLPRPGAGGTQATYDSYHPQQLDYFKKGQLYSYLQSPTLLLCPADILNANFYVRQQYLTSYCWNGAAVRFEASGAQNDTVRFSDPNVRGNYILIWENDEKKVALTGQWNDFSNFPDEGISTRHGDGATVATLDGGALRMDMREFYKLAGTYPSGNPGGGPPGQGVGTSKNNTANGNMAMAPNELWWYP